MNRNETTNRLLKELKGRRDELLRQIDEDLGAAHTEHTNSGDPVDAAQDVVQCEIHSQLAAFETRELHQIERAIDLVRSGQYGVCEDCGQKIPAARLKALPATTVCVECARVSGRGGRNGRAESARSGLRLWNPGVSTDDEGDKPVALEELEAGLK
jgi:DnaK suppressor protein